MIQEHEYHIVTNASSTKFKVLHHHIIKSGFLLRKTHCTCIEYGLEFTSAEDAELKIYELVTQPKEFNRVVKIISGT